MKSSIEAQPGPTPPVEVSMIWQIVGCMGPLLVHEIELIMSITQVKLGRIWILRHGAVIAIS